MATGQLTPARATEIRERFGTPCYVYDRAVLEAAVARVYRDGKTLTPDQGGAATTRQMAEAVLAAYRNA